MRAGRGAKRGRSAAQSLLICLFVLGVATAATLSKPDLAAAQGKAVPVGPSNDDDEAPSRPWGDGGDQPPGTAGASAVEREELPHNLIDKDETNVERVDLAPLGAAEGAPFAASAWTMTAPKDLEALIERVPVPLKSWALSRAWVRLLEADATANAGGTTLDLARAHQLEALGLFEPALKLLTPLAGAATKDRVRLEISRGRTKDGCDLLAAERVDTSALPVKSQVEAALLAGFCAALRGDMTEAGLAAGIARDLGGKQSAGPDLLDSIASGNSPKIEKRQALSPLDYRILDLKGGVEAAAILDAATPALLVTLARSDTASDDLRLPAAERAARLGLVSAPDLSAALRLPHPGGTADTIERAALYKRIEAEQTPLRKARLIRAFLDEAHRQDMHVAGYLLMMAPIQVLTPSPELYWFAETAIEASLLSGRFDTAKRWADAYASNGLPQRGGSIALWRALIDIVEPKAPDALRQVGALSALASQNVATPELMARLSYSLDALDIGMPEVLWDARSNLPVPTTGHLPDTGILTDLKAASEARDIARTVLLAISAIGPSGAEGAHLLALGDCIRAFKRAGLDAEARLLALEVLLPVWPRIALE